MRPVFIGVLPNFEREEYSLARRLLFRGTQQAGDVRPELSTNLQRLFGKNAQRIHLVDSARSAFYLALESLKLPPGSEVILPGFTCVVIVNPVLWAGLKPVYADIQPLNFNTSVKELVAHVTEKTKVILVQHTFGVPVDVVKLRDALAKIGRKDIIIVEDLAHVLGGKDRYDNPLGSNGDLAVMTFGVEKSISSIKGGALLVNDTKLTKSLNLASEIEEGYAKLPEMSSKIERRLLLNPLFWSIATPTYYLGIGRFTVGKILVALAHKFNLLGIQIEPEEYHGGKPEYLPAKLSPKLAEIALLQLGKLDRLNQHRRNLAKIYAEAITDTDLMVSPEQKFIATVLAEGRPHTFLRYPLLLESSTQRKKLFKLARDHKIVLGDWYKTMFYTDPKYLPKLQYDPGTCPKAEEVSDLIVNLSTSINTTTEHAKLVARLVTQLS